MLIKRARYSIKTHLDRCPLFKSCRPKIRLVRHSSELEFSKPLAVFHPRTLVQFSTNQFLHVRCRYTVQNLNQSKAFRIDPLKAYLNFNGLGQIYIFKRYVLYNSRSLTLGY
jgi:hypothetical protein